MTLNVNLEDVPWEILEAVKARIMANRRKLEQEESNTRESLRPRPQYAKFGATSRSYRRPEPAVPALAGGNGWLLVPSGPWQESLQGYKCIIRGLPIGPFVTGENDFDYVDNKLRVASSEQTGFQVIESSGVYDTRTISPIPGSRLQRATFEGIVDTSDVMPTGTGNVVQSCFWRYVYEIRTQLFEPTIEFYENCGLVEYLKSQEPFTGELFYGRFTPFFLENVDKAQWIADNPDLTVVETVPPRPVSPDAPNKVFFFGNCFQAARNGPWIPSGFAFNTVPATLFLDVPPSQYFQWPREEFEGVTETLISETRICSPSGSIIESSLDLELQLIPDGATEPVLRVVGQTIVYIGPGGFTGAYGFTIVNDDGDSLTLPDEGSQRLHYAFTIDQGSVTAYVNGQLLLTAESPAINPDINYNILIRVLTLFGDPDSTRIFDSPQSQMVEASRHSISGIRFTPGRVLYQGESFTPPASITRLA